MHGGRQLVAVAWLFLAVLVQVVAFEAVRRFFVTTARGQQLDTAALAGNSIGQEQFDTAVDTILSTVTVLSLIVAVAGIGFIALIRRRVLLAAVATATVICANITTQLAKELTTRPELGIDAARMAAGNSLPSGHTTVTASVVVALMLVLPASVRAAAALIGAGVTATVGVATLSAGWHRPSDVVAALLVVGIWAGVAGMVLVIAGRAAGPGAAAMPSGQGSGPRQAGHPITAATLVLVALASLVTAAVAMVVTDTGLADPLQQRPPELLSRPRLLLAYFGGAAGIVGATCALLAGVLAMAPRVVPAGAGWLLKDRGYSAGR